MSAFLRKDVVTPDGIGRCVGFRGGSNGKARYMVQFAVDTHPEKALEYQHNNVACYAWYYTDKIKLGA